MTPSDHVLLQAWHERRDANAFSELVLRYAGMVHATAGRILRSPTEAEDVAQECFIKLASSAATIDRSLGGWLHTTATRQALDVLRARDRRQTRESVYEQTRTGAAQQQWDEVQALVDEAIASLPPGQRDVVVAHYLQGRTYAAIAKDLGLTRAGVAMRASRGVALVREHLTRKGVVIPLVLLASGLTAQAAHAAPQALVSSLGKLALTGGVVSINTTGATSGALTLGGIIVMKKMVTIGAIALLALLGGTAGTVYYWRTYGGHNSKVQQNNAVRMDVEAALDRRTGFSTETPYHISFYTHILADEGINPIVIDWSVVGPPPGSTSPPVGDSVVTSGVRPPLDMIKGTRRAILQKVFEPLGLVIAVGPGFAFITTPDRAAHNLFAEPMVRTPASPSLQAVLEKPCEMNYRDESLSNILFKISKEMGCPIDNETGRDPGVPRVAIVPGLPLKDSLKALTCAVAMDYVIDGERLVVVEAS